MVIRYSVQYLLAKNRVTRPMKYIVGSIINVFGGYKSSAWQFMDIATGWGYNRIGKVWPPSVVAKLAVCLAT